MSDKAPDILGFDHTPRTRMVFAPGAAARLGDLARELGGRVALLASDPGVAAAGHEARLRQALEAAGLEVVVFDAVRPNPTTADVDACLAAARSRPVDVIVGLGGGSAMDTAKGCNFLLTNGGRMQDYRGVGKAVKPLLPMIAVPTTAGTGSECQSFALIADDATHRKMACGDPKAAPRIALLDPVLTLTQPRVVTATTGMDALAHAVETAVTSRRTALSLAYSREAFRLVHGALERVLSAPDDLPARADMQLGAALAGLAIENSMLGAAHAAANPLTARFGVVHGQAVGRMLPGVVRFNAADAGASDGYAALARAAALVDSGAPAPAAAEALVLRIERLLAAAGLDQPLVALGVRAKDIPALAADAAEQWTAGFNPRPIAAPDFAGLYRAVLEGE